jgi:membrane peptidoglycan carboxypeptidase
MTGSARRLPQHRVNARLSPRTRAALTLLELDRGRPSRLPVFRIALVLFICAVVGLASMGGVAAMVGANVVGSLTTGMPDPKTLTSLDFAQPTVIYDRTGKVELARFERENRRVVTFDELPKLILDTTTAAEDRTFWQNDGFDLGAIVAAALQNASGESQTERGASTITQQLVRARLLPSDVALSNDRYLRKVMELLQASRLTAAFPGEEGKEQIITAYLNQIYYGHRAFGIAAAAKIYFGVTDLSKLTLAQAALLAGLPKAPSTYDPYRYAVKDSSGQLVVPLDSAPAVRRDYVLRGMSTARWTHVSPDELQAALAEPVVLAGEQPAKMRAAHFSWAVRDELEQILGSPDAVETGGYTVITSLDWNAQQLAERYMYAAAIIPNEPSKQAAKDMERLKLNRTDRRWVNGLRGKDLNDGALVALDYRTGDVLAYVGSASYDRLDLASKRFQPQFDAAGAPRQPGSAFKPIVYATAFDRHVLTPGSVLLDISTNFGGGWTPKDADRFERGPVRVRQALQQSLNLPAIRALERVGNDAVAETAKRMDLDFLNGRKAFLQAGLAGAIGTVETKPIDLTSAFGTFPNGGVHVPTRMILSITGPGGSEVYTAPKPAGVQAVSPQAAFLISDILNGNTDMHQNPIWASTLELRNGPHGSRRPAAVKTGTADNNMDFGAYGFLAPPKDKSQPGLAVGIWMGNSDHSAPRTNNPPNSLQAAGEIWHAYVREVSKKWPVADFKRPDGLVQERIDRWSGGKPGPWTHGTVEEWFIKGTQPSARRPVDQAGLLYSRACGTWVVDPMKAELGPRSWLDDVQAWVNRARRGTGVKGPYGSTTAYFFGQSSWGGQLIGPCGEPKQDQGGGGKDKKGGHKPPPPPPDGAPPADATAPQEAPGPVSSPRRRRS